MFLSPLLAPRLAPPNVPAWMADAESAVSCHVAAAAFAGSATAPTARALPSSGSPMTPTGPAELEAHDFMPFCVRPHWALPDHLTGRAVDRKSAHGGAAADGPASRMVFCMLLPRFSRYTAI